MAVTVEVPAGRDVTLDAASAVEVELAVGKDLTVDAGTISGPPGPPGASQTSFNHEQFAPAVVWTVDHNLGFWPVVEVFDTTGRRIISGVTNPTLNRTTLSFSAAVAGTARLS